MSSSELARPLNYLPLVVGYQVVVGANDVVGSHVVGDEVGETAGIRTLSWLSVFLECFVVVHNFYLCIVTFTDAR